MNAALLLVDLQRDFLVRPHLAPPATLLIARVRTLLAACRTLQVPVLHCHTAVAADGADRMPHWRRTGRMECVVGSSGAAPPDALAPQAGEPVLRKRFFSAFRDGRLEIELRQRGIETLVLAGNYLHGCIRATAFDAYERGFDVRIAADAVGSTEPDHAEATRLYLEGRAAHFATTASIVEALGGPPDPGTFRRRNPSDWEQVSCEFRLATEADVARACSTAWAGEVGGETLRRCAELLEQRSSEWAALIAAEIGKPVRDGLAEVRAAMAHTLAATKLERDPQLRAHGLVALITPWNNPLAIPLAKIAPALALGNRVVWKAALEAPRVARAVIGLLADAGVPPGAVQLLLGGADAARVLIDRPEVGAVSLTGSIATGRAAAVRCLRTGKPLQAELGGNNAAVVLRDFDFESAAPELARSAFSFAGQRCTATRRFVVERSIAPAFERALVAATRALRLGDPHDAATDVGPLVSRAHRDAIVAGLEGEERVCGGDLPPELAQGCWLRPAIVRASDPESRLAQEESFGPVALILTADDEEEAVAIANGVEHGLAATVLTGDAAVRARIAARMEAGVVKFTPGPFAIDAFQPFGGWKASRLGPPEHGRWDREFYTRAQARYGGDGC